MRNEAKCAQWLTLHITKTFLYGTVTVSCGNFIFQQLHNAWKHVFIIIYYFFLWDTLSNIYYTVCHVCTSRGLIFTLLSSKFITFGNLDFWPEAESIIYNTGPKNLLIIRRLIRNPEIERATVIVSMYSSVLCISAFPCNQIASTPTPRSGGKYVIDLSLCTSLLCLCLLVFDLSRLFAFADW